MSTTIIWVYYLFISYLIGSISFSYYISKVLWKEDIRDKGSGNAGASNMTINYGWRYGVLVFFLDFLKTFLLVKFISFLPMVYQLSDNQIFYLALSAGLMTILGHVYPIGMKFRGGKGTASAIGLAFALSYKLGVIGLTTIVLITLITKYVAIGAIMLWLSLALGAWFIFRNYTVVGLLIIYLAFSLYLHRANIYRIINGEETSLKLKFDKKDRIKK